MFRILVVEDDENARTLLEHILYDGGYEPLLAADGTEALDVLDRKYVDLILLDLKMPNMDGYEATRQIRALPDAAKAGIPIFAMTANAFEEDRQNALKAGMDGHIAKPLDIPHLLQVLADVLK